MNTRKTKSKPTPQKPSIKINMGKKQAFGLDAINDVIDTVYGDDEEPYNHIPPVKYWEGGPDPLDAVSVFRHKSSANVPEHWHYITFGLTDIHGDGRIKEFETVEDQEVSGFGFELTFRVPRKPKQKQPPTWPINLLNTLARYVFKTGNTLQSGDHIPWHQPLNGSAQSIIRHMMVTDDPELGQGECTAGSFGFRQVVGLTDDELQLVQRWSGNSLIKEMQKLQQLGGPLMVTNPDRQQSAPELRDTLATRAYQLGSNLGHVMAVCSWEEGFRRTARDSLRDLAAVTLKFDLEAAALLPIIMSQRLDKGQYFVYQNLIGQVIVFIPYSFHADMVTVTEDQPIRAQGEALQIYCSLELIKAMATDLKLLENTAQLQDSLPISFEIDSPKVTIEILEENQIKHME